MAFAQFLGPDVSFYDVKTKEEIIAFLDTKIKSIDEDPDRESITTWNDYLNDIKYFFRWLYNNKKKTDNEYKEKDEIASLADLETPSFANIKKKKTKRLSPYLETELWEREELLLIIKYEQFKRNKAALSLFWDLDARNHEVTLLKIKHIRLREKSCTESNIVVLPSGRRNNIPVMAIVSSAFFTFCSPHSKIKCNYCC